VGKRRKSPNIRGCQKIDWLFLPELKDLRNLTFVFRDQENQFAASNSNGVTMCQQFASHGDSIDERTVMALEVKQLKSGVGLANGEVTPRHGAVAKAQVIG
jgi:hypothetical protein